MKTAIALAAIFSALGLGSMLGASYLLDQRAYSVFDARSDGFNAGIQYARQEADRNARLGLCVYAELACMKPKPKGKK